ncbi:MAG: hypothetical protein AAGG69_12600 [Pseudomonadota bacterium]
MKTKFISVVLLTSALAAGAAPASASALEALQRGGDRGAHSAVVDVHHKGQRFGKYRQQVRYGILPKRAIYRSLYRKGFRNVHNLRFHKGRYIARAYGYRGLVRLTISARTGQITKREVIRQYRTRGHQSGLRLHWRFN